MQTIDATLVGGRVGHQLRRLGVAIRQHVVRGQAFVVFVDQRAVDGAVTQQTDIEKQRVLVVNDDGCAGRIPALLSIFSGHEVVARCTHDISAGDEAIHERAMGIGARGFGRRGGSRQRLESHLRAG